MLKLARLVLLALLTGLLLAGCQENQTPKTLQGYVEADYTYVASPLAGRLDDLAVERGQTVAGGALLFRLETDLERDTLSEAQQRLAQARDKLSDTQKGARPTEIRALEASLNKAQSSLELATLAYERRKKLYKQKAIPEAELDKARAEYQRDKAQVVELGAQLETARLGGREDVIKGAQAEVQALEAKQAQAQWNLDQKTQNAPAGGVVFDTFYTKGEWVPAGSPVTALVTPGNIKVRFFIPETKISILKLGQEVFLSCDGCPSGLSAKISYISPQAEYTPPVIYSNQTRAKLVFMIEARPPKGKALKLHPGQPMDVALSKAEAAK